MRHGQAKGGVAVSLAQAVIDLVVEAAYLAVQYTDNAVKRWMYGGDLAQVDSLSDQHVTHAPETDDELRERFKVARRAL